MNTATGEPAGSRAVLVAVETYETGSSWDLDGPVRDALAYRAWLLGRGVPADSITVLASPLSKNRALLEAAGVEWRVAGREGVHQALFREQAAVAGDWLFVAWSGHGLVDLEGHRRLVYADAAPGDLRSLDLESALAAFRSDVAPGHPRQLWLVDACQTFTDVTSVGHALRPDPVPRGRLRQVEVQQVLFACGPGQVTGTRSGPDDTASGGAPRASGTFSATALDLLLAHPEWRHDTAALATALRERFRANGMTSGGPTSLWFEGAGDAVRTEVRRATPRRRLELADHRRLCTALEAVPVMRDPGLRAAVIGHLPLEVCTSVPRNAVTRVEILELIRTCLVFENGLGHLWGAVSLLDAGTMALDELRAVLNDYPEWFTTE
ncbi:effector-associated domain 2-containing protein [Streptomyces spinosirectus]